MTFRSRPIAHPGVALHTVVHCDEPKSTRFARHPVYHQMDFIDGAMLFEES
jgi:hypothetical protein